MLLFFHMPKYDPWWWPYWKSDQHQNHITESQSSNDYFLQLGSPNDCHCLIDLPYSMGYWLSKCAYILNFEIPVGQLTYGNYLSKVTRWAQHMLYRDPSHPTHTLNVKIYFCTAVQCTRHILHFTFYFPYLSLLAQPVTIFVYGPARYLHYYFR